VDGNLYVVGTGPGSADLMTLRALKTLQSCSVIFYPVTRKKSGKEKCRALETVKEVVDLTEKILIPLEFSMGRKDSLLYLKARDKCLEFLKEGKDCAFITIGDPSVFSTAGKFSSLISEAGFKTKFIAGITSFCQAAASASKVLCQSGDDMRLICGDEWFFDGRLKDEFCTPGAKVIMKMNKSLPQILMLVTELGIQKKCFLVQNASLKDERIIYGESFLDFAKQLLGHGDQSLNYFSVLICNA